ncbi:MAG: KH domain-containing protein [Candidatus Pacearchaeota archaeon]
MKTLQVTSVRKILQHKKELEEKLKVKIIIKGTHIIISGSEIDEHFAERVFSALDFPFLVEDALLLASEDYLIEVLDIKDYTKRKDLNVVKGRIIGTKGKTLRVLSEISNSEIVVKDNNVAIIGRAEDIHTAEQAVISLIQGSKQGNVYAFLEKANRRKREL